VSRRGAGARRDYDLAINFEGDLRSHALIALGGARRRVGFAMAGGGPLLTDVVAHRPDRHTRTTPRAVPPRFRSTPAPGSRQPGDARPGRPGARFGSIVPDAARPRRRATLIGPHPRYLVVHASGGAPSSNGISIASPPRRPRSPARWGRRSC
jgi:ADP-heptose:LPS heptosyltransferase